MNCVSEGATAALWPSCAYEMLGGVQRSGEPVPGVDGCTPHTVGPVATAGIHMRQSSK